MNMRLLQNTSFGPISVSGSNFNPRNTQCMSVVKIFAFLELEQKYIFFKGLNILFLKTLAYSNAQNIHLQKNKIYAQTVRTGTFQAPTLKKR